MGASVKSRKLVNFTLHPPNSIARNTLVKANYLRDAASPDQLRDGIFRRYFVSIFRFLKE